ncbi:MAG: flagellar export protein FliJ [Methanothrix sp.]|nr:MAG: flagellar export protein FliJ [Methanothrix sp.]
MGFTFRFETLLKVRKIKENIAQQAFSKAHRHYLNLVNLKNLRIAAKKEMQGELRSRMKTGLAVSLIKQYYDYLAFLDENIRQLDKNLVSSEKQLDEKRTSMLQAKKEHKAIGRLKEIDVERYMIEQDKAEMRVIDEMAILRHGENR